MRLILAAALAAAPFAALAQDESPQDIALEARQGYFEMLSVNMGTLAGMAKGDVAYDEAAATKAGANIEALTKYDPTIHFLEGTSTAELGDRTEAKPEIWADMAGFSAKYANLQKAATGAAEAVKGGQDKLGPVVQTIGGACKSCHDSYRAE